MGGEVNGMLDLALRLGILGHVAGLVGRLAVRVRRGLRGRATGEGGRGLGWVGVGADSGRALY
jgi:hypothetical protein